MVGFALTALSSPTTEALLARYVTDEDRRHAARRTGHATRVRTLAARGLTRHLLQARTGVDGRGWRFVVDRMGKPWAVSPSGRAGPAVSLSHSGPLIAVAVAEVAALGVDLEARRQTRRVMDLAAVAFGERERAEVEARGHAAFYRIWTLREAFAKATGQGLSRAADRSDIVAGSPDSGAWTARVESATWLFAHLEPRPGFSLAIAARPSGEDHVRAWSAATVRDLSDMLPGCRAASS